MAVSILVYTICLLCPWQLYIPSLLPGSISLVQWLVGLLVFTVMMRSLLDPGARRVPVTLPLLILGAFIALCLLATVWSPDPVLAVKTSVKLGAIIVVAWAVSTLNGAQRRRAAALLGTSAAVLAIMVVAFRLVPLFELGYWYSPVAEYTIDPEILDDFRSGSIRANIQAADRAGGVFSNVNAASLFLGMVLYLVLTVVPRGRFRTAVSVVLVAGVLATGSKAGLAALALTGTVWIATTTPRRVSLFRSAALLLGSLGAALGFLWLLAGLGLGQAGRVSLESRVGVWIIALPVVAERPLLGLGFGGWQLWAEENFRELGLAVVYPLHNLLLIGWAWTGLFGSLLLAAFLALALGESWARGGRASAAGHVTGGIAAVGLFLAFAWFAVQSMFTNAAVTDVRIGIPLGICLALLAALEPAAETATSRGVGAA